MARLIVKSPYIKCSGKGGAEGYLRYIGTREHVEIMPDDPTPTQSSEVYARYIATRPRAERLGSHGLFGDEDHVNLNAAMKELKHYTGNVWTHIISLKREDAERLGYDHASAWRNLLRAHRNDVAAAMHIPPNDFRWYAAFHDEGDHPHVHMMAWSKKPGQAHLSREGIHKIRSELTNDIFRHEMLHVYERKSTSRDELVHAARKAVMDLAGEMQRGIYDHPQAEKLMQELAEELGAVKGKKVYSYLPKALKKKVNQIVDEMEQMPVVAECYEKWLDLQWQVDSYYKDERRQRKKLSEEKEFRAIKNAIIREAERIRLDAVSFENEGLSHEDEPEEFDWPTEKFWNLYLIVTDEEIPMDERDQAVQQMERLAEGGDADAQYTMGRLYRDGPLLIPDWVNAAHWFDKAARQNHVAAQYALGKLLLSDDREVRNIEAGTYWLDKASRNGSSYAAYRIGKEYLRGELVNKDAGKAAQYFQQAAERGNQYAQYMLGKLHLSGNGVPQDRHEALYWMQLSAEQGHRYAQHFIDRWDSMRLASVMLSVTRLLYHMAGVFRDQTPTPPVPGGIQFSRRRYEQLLREKGYEAARSYVLGLMEQRGYNGQSI